MSLETTIIGLLALCVLCWTSSNSNSAKRQTSERLGIYLPDGSELKKIIRQQWYTLLTDPSILQRKDIVYEHNIVTPDMNVSDPSSALCESTKLNAFNTIMYIPAESEHMQQVYSSAVTNLGQQGIPVIAWTTDQELGGKLGTAKILQLAPSANLQCQAVLQLFARFEWKQFYIVRTVNNGRQFADRCRKHVESGVVIADEIVIPPFDDRQHVINTIKQRLLKQPRPAVILLLCNRIGTWRWVPNSNWKKALPLFTHHTREEFQKLMEISDALQMHNGDFVWVTTRSATRSRIIPIPRSNSIPRVSNGLHDARKGVIALDYDTSVDHFGEIFGASIRGWMNSAWRVKATTHVPPLNASFLCQERGQIYEWSGGLMLERELRKTNLGVSTFLSDGTINSTRISFVNLPRVGASWKSIAWWEPGSGISFTNSVTWPGSRRSRPKIPLTVSAAPTNLPQHVALALTLALLATRAYTTPSIKDIGLCS